MKELISRAQCDDLIWIVAALGLIAGPLAAFLARKRGENPVKFGLLFGGPLISIAVLWHVYNAIEDHFGLDSVAGLAINFGLFFIVGVGCGTGWVLAYGNRDADSSDVGQSVVEKS